MNARDYTRRDFLKSISLGAAAIAVPGCLAELQQSAEAGKPSRKPNFVFILIDDMGWKDAGFMGSGYYETPNIDKLASEGVVFTSAYANAPNCAPSRACLMSGQYMPRHGVYTVGNPARGQSHLRKLIPIANKTTLDSGVVTIAEALKPAGYVSVSIGKWNLGNDPEFGPISQGFDLNIGGSLSGKPGSYFSPYGVANLEDGPEDEYLTDRLTTEALKFIEANKDRPFFVYLSHYAVHSPFQAKKEMIEAYKNKEPADRQNNPTYAAMVESVDQSVGRIMDKLDELHLSDNTVVFFFSDNGGVGLYGEYGRITSMDPLRGTKGMLYEGGIREPMIVRWPGRVEAGSICERPVIGIDFYPTILEMAGVPRPSGHILDGESLVPLLTQSGSLKREAIFWHFPAYLQSFTSGGDIWRTTPAGAVREGDWKLIEFFEDGRLELYNLREDIGEKNNLAKTMPEKAKQLKRLLVEWRKSVNALVPTEKNPLYAPNAKSAGS